MAFVRTGLVPLPPVRRPRRRFGVRDRGFGGVAPCPSIQQLQGIVDMTDSCQSGELDTIDANNAAAITAQLNPPLSSSPMSATFLGVPLPYAVLGGVVLGLMLISSSGGRRR